MRTITPEQEHALRCAEELLNLPDILEASQGPLLVCLSRLNKALRAAGYLQPVLAPAPPPWDRGAPPPAVLPGGSIGPAEFAAMGKASLKGSE